ncbi:MAG: XdhC/CoxI family protein [Rhodobacteraceae bacterium]|nr:XdhC/CoxI family protein [Paracoccaceae bacterium]
MQNYDNTIEIALEWLAAGKAVALATVIETWGSAPRPVGSQLVISGEAEIMGSVSGGCVEGAVVEEALEALESGACTVLEYGVTSEDAFAVGLACGGNIKILVEPVGVGQGPDVALLKALAAKRAAREAVAYTVHLESWARELLGPGATLVDDRFISDKSGLNDGWFIGIHNPPLRMVIVGAVHIAQPLVYMARLCGFDVALNDPREAFASAVRFPDENLVHDWPDEALAAMKMDARTAVVTLSHDPKIDDPAILTALKTPVFYLGCLGSSRTHAKRLARLEAGGVTARDIARIHAPVGADIGAKTPAEIAVSIMAQITERLRRPETRP